MVRGLYKRPQVKLVRQCNPEPYMSFEFGVSAELRNGAVVDFWIEVSATDTGWDVHPEVMRHDPDEDGSHPEFDLGNRSVTSAKDLPGTLLQALRELREAIGVDTRFR